jgi:ribosomal-protein-alanine N-acetyltransferase
VTPRATERLVFREWSPDDFELFWTLYGDIEVTRLFGGPFSREQVRARFDAELANLATLGVQYWPLFADQDFVGVCGLKPHGENFAFGFHLRPEHWGRGYATEASRAVLAYARNVLHATTVFAGHHPDNARSQRALEKLGFRYQRDEFYEPTGRMHKTYLLTV